MMMDLKKFFKEKALPCKRWQIEYNGIIHFIDSDVVIEAILATRGKERAQICATLFALDFRNGNIYPYLKFLASCMIENSHKNGE